jgi:hypothetical protein
MCTEEALKKFLERFPDSVALVVPVGSKFADVRKRLEILFEVR